MKINIYAVYDAKAEAFGKPLFFNKHGLAKRSFYEACQHAESEFKKYPHDYSLHFIGEYNEDSAELSAVPTKQLYTALEAINSQNTDITE
jgi:hypothetical protein